jgi:DNA integrity scanning protein DisA with diadenylate cyclase activity
MKIKSGYFLLFIALLVIELLIGTYLHDAFIRPLGGDFLVVILIYCFIKSFIDAPIFKTAIGVLIFSYAVEISQYFHLVKILGLQHSRVALLILGNSFSYYDLLCYTLGILLVLFVERIRIGRKLSFN